MSIYEAAQRSRIEALEAMRDKLAADMDEAPVTVVAQVAARLQAVLAELAALHAEQPKSESRADELARRRKDRLAEAGVDTSSGRKRNVRRS